MDRRGVPPRTNVIRWVNGAGDALQDFYLDGYGPCVWLATTRDGAQAAALTGPAENRSLYWLDLDPKASALPVHLHGPRLDGRFQVMEEGLNYWIDFQAGYSQGLFFDQRLNRKKTARLCRGGALLNCFAYTCAFSVAAAAAGATTTSVDLSNRFLDWGRDNFQLNNLNPDQHEFFSADVFDFLRGAAKRGRTFQVVVLDPPTFSRNRRGKVFRLERDFPRLVEAASKVVAPGGALLCSTNQAKLSSEAFLEKIRQGLGGVAPGEVTPGEIPPDFRGPTAMKSWWVEFH